MAVLGILFGARPALDLQLFMVVAFQLLDALLIQADKVLLADAFLFARRTALRIAGLTSGTVNI